MFSKLLSMFCCCCCLNSSVIRQKCQSQKRVLQKKQSKPNFPKNKHFLPPDAHTHLCSGFLKKLACFVFLWHPFWDSPFCLIDDEFSHKMLIVCYYKEVLCNITRTFPWKFAFHLQFQHYNFYFICVCLFIAMNRNTRTLCKICSKLTIKTSERRQWHSFHAFIINYEQISRNLLVFPLLNLNK